MSDLYSHDPALNAELQEIADARSRAPEPHTLLSKLEPEAEHGLDPQHALLSSIAVSLKRIADAMTSPVKEYDETMPEAIAGNIARELRSQS